MDFRQLERLAGRTINETTIGLVHFFWGAAISFSRLHPSSAVRSVRVTFCFQTRLVFVTKSDPSCPHCGNDVGLHLEPRELCTEQTPIRCFCCFKEATAGAWSEAAPRPERRVGLPERRRFSRTDRRATQITSRWLC